VAAFNNVYGATGAVTELFEVWLIDTGKFIVLRDELPEFTGDWRWMRILRQRRALRMFLPEIEIAKLPAIETVFSVANRGFEMRDTLERWEKAAGGPAKPFQAMFSIAGRGSAITQAVERWRREDGAKMSPDRATLRTVAAHAALFPKEAEMPVRNVPRKHVPRCWITPEEEERRKRVAAGLEPDTPQGKPKQDKPKKAKKEKAS
jgi:hypothetical protein